MRSRRRRAAIAAVATFATLLPFGTSAARSETAGPPGEWLAGDLHVHTRFSHDSYGGPADDNTGPDEAYTLGLSVADEFLLASTRGLDFLAITDHNDVRSQGQPAFGAYGVIPIRGYENSLHGHAQMLGADHVYDNGDASVPAVQSVADQLRADGGVFQVNHPGSPAAPDWGYGYDVQPDTVEVWNIARLYQPPFPSGSDNDGAIDYWEGWLDRGAHVGATGGSDSHWVSTAAVQGAGQPTTYVFAADRSPKGVLAALRAGRTFISWQPPALGGPRVFLEADGDGDGSYESMVGDTVSAASAFRVRVDGALGATVRLIGTHGQVVDETSVTADRFTYRFAVPSTMTWLRAEVVLPDGASVRAQCDQALGEQTTYCRNQIGALAMTSALYLRAPGTGPTVTVRGNEVTISNGLIARTWSLSPFQTERLVDLRTGRVWARDSNDFRVVLDGLPMMGNQFTARVAERVRLANGGVRLRFDLGPLDRIVEMYPGVAGTRSQTVVKIPGVLTSYTLDEATTGTNLSATLHAFRAGADWREAGWEPSLALGDAHTGDWRATTHGARGAAVAGPGQWLSMERDDRSSLFMVMERNDFPSSTMAFEAGRAMARVDLGRDVVSLGPFEEDAHVENPLPAQAPVPARARVVLPPLVLESVFTGVAVDADDEPWQHYAYLSRFRNLGYPKPVTFNSDSVDDNRISTGSKDDMNLAEVVRQASVARQLGVETFILDDGWQARSGDWCPDSPECPEPRADRFAPRFPDATFAAVREALGPDLDLGLWMSPMAFHPSSEAFNAHPEWSCVPLGTATGAASVVMPDEGSYEPGIGLWSPAAIPHVESRIRTAIRDWDVRFFKFDFLVWLDCAGLPPTDLYQYREAFVAMLDRLIADYPDVVFQIDETNDYRLFPFESVARGPSWFQNGAPATPQLLHNLWNLNPWVPGSSIGQHLLGGDERTEHAVDYLMAAALGSEITFKTDLTTLSSDEIAAARRWVDLYKQYRPLLTGFTFPLLGDPASGRQWAALQPWDMDAQRGMVLAYRQGATAESQSIPLRGLRADSYRVTNVSTGEVLGVYSRAQLAGEGLPVTLPAEYTAAVLLVEPAP